ncbi:type 2 lanthipeptide synthetase LanM family protein [Saccharothrix sp. Mg75]|uniref:type 2 lanthipeptide synthetase LanM family protein n=1 Tax=Saccharothrix sp. Mg75 TaxID=3445357 RepID=UPI003EED13CD
MPKPVHPTTAAVLPEAWWLPGLAPHERGGHATSGSAARQDDRRIALPRGCTEPGPGPGTACDELLGGPPTGVRRPDWAATVERVVRRAAPVRTAVELGGTWRAAFTRVLRPFTDDAVARITEGSGAAAPPGVLASTGTALGDRLVDIAARTLVTELRRSRAGDERSARPWTGLPGFTRHLSSPAGLAELVTTYPVLARLLAQACDRTAVATLDLLDRLAADRALVVDSLLGGTDPGPVAALVPGDRHGGAPPPVLVRFADGNRVVYHSHDVLAQVRVGEFVGLLAGVVPDFRVRAARALPRPGYGWSEFVAGNGVPDASAAGRFHRGQGALLALLHLLRATGLHHTNVVADGDTPVLVDVQALFDPDVAPSPDHDPAEEALRASVHRIGLLTGPAGRPSTPGDHRSALLTGFRQAYDAITAYRGTFAEAIAACADIDVRVLARPVAHYRAVLDETTRPEVLRDALDRDRVLSALVADRTGIPAQLADHEVTALRNGEVPVFTASAGRGRLRAPSGAPLPVPLPRSGVAASIDTLSGLDEVDRANQEWIISAALATRHRVTAHPTAAPIAAPRVGPVVHPDQLIAATCAVADRLVVRAFGGDRVNWLGVEAVADRRWSLSPLGVSLGNGSLGVAVFLAQLAAVTGVARYADQAVRAVAGTTGMVDAFAGRPDLVDAVGWGGLAGLGGVAYGLGRLSLLLDDRALRHRAARLVALADGSVPAVTEPGWVGGLAGCLAAMTAVQVDLGLDGAGEVARGCADRLTRLVDRPDRDRARLPVAFADGLAGIGWALATLGPETAHRDAGSRLGARVAEDVAARGAPVPDAWCRGGAGVALVGAGTAFADGPVRRDLSLCHGEMGVLEVLGLLSGSRARHDPTADALRRRTGQVLDVLRRYGPACGVPGTTTTPGLLTGLAGIGYGLLRLAAPRRVPSILLLSPAAITATG